MNYDEINENAPACAYWIGIHKFEEGFDREIMPHLGTPVGNAMEREYYVQREKLRTITGGPCGRCEECCNPIEEDMPVWCVSAINCEGTSFMQEIAAIDETHACARVKYQAGETIRVVEVAPTYPA